MITLQDGTTISPFKAGSFIRFDRNGHRLKVGDNDWSVEALQAIVDFLKAAPAKEKKAAKVEKRATARRSR